MHLRVCSSWRHVSLGGDVHALGLVYQQWECIIVLPLLQYIEELLEWQCPPLLLSCNMKVVVYLVEWHNVYFIPANPIDAVYKPK
jgi:hypothetical protein